MAALSDQVVLVTGGARGLGAAIVQRLAEDGARVFAADRDAERAQECARRLRSCDLEVEALALDVCAEEEVRRTMDDLARRCGRLDTVINNAAIDVTLPIEELSIDHIDRVLQTNLRGPFLVARAAVAHMRPNRRGNIINITSTAAKRAWPNASAYHATKWGLLGLSHALHAELRPMGIRVTAIVAGGMKTPFLFERFPDIDVSTLQDPANVARAVHFALTLPPESVVPEIMVLPMRETSWP
jgi:NAD(P)-dependent dehydrogenase (short-subunit alcohol dehydrogenase family)